MGQEGYSTGASFRAGALGGAREGTRGHDRGEECMSGLGAALAGYEGLLVGYERPAQVVAGVRKKVRWRVCGRRCEKL